MTEKERDEIIEFTENLITAKKKETELLDSLIHDVRYGNSKLMQNHLISFARDSEQNFLTGKQLFIFVRDGEIVSDCDPEYMGTTDTFPCSFSSDNGIYMFHIPPTPSIKIGKIGPNAGRYTGYLMKNLIKKHIQTFGAIEYINYPVVIFEYGIDNNTPFAKLYDADNRDNKKALDALTGTFFKDDNVLAVTTIHYGFRTDEPCTNIYVMELYKFMEIAAETAKSDNDKMGVSTLSLFQKIKGKN